MAGLTKHVSSRPRDSSETSLLGKLVGHRASLSLSLPRRKVSDESLGRDQTGFKTSHEIMTSNCQLYTLFVAFLLLGESSGHENCVGTLPDNTSSSFKHFPKISPET